MSSSKFVCRSYLWKIYLKLVKRDFDIVDNYTKFKISSNDGHFEWSENCLPFRTTWVHSLSLSIASALSIVCLRDNEFMIFVLFCFNLVSVSTFLSHDYPCYLLKKSIYTPVVLYLEFQDQNRRLLYIFGGWFGKRMRHKYLC